MEIPDWHKRFKQQAGWTENLRSYLLSRIELPQDAKVLDVGCGTGALLPEFAARSSITIGLDINFSRLTFAQTAVSEPNLLCADANNIPLPSACFDLTFCHYMLLWFSKPLMGISEMARVTREEGYVIAFAEPDYQARIDYPEVFQKIGELQNHSLRFQGVNLIIGRQLGQLFTQAGLKDVRTGVLAGEWTDLSQNDFEAEWSVIAYDLGGLVATEKILDMRAEAKEAWLSGSPTLYVPTLYAFGRV